jgi:hypothetical protein
VSADGRNRRLYAPRRVEVGAGEDGVPREVAGVGVDAVREEWIIEDRWWTPRGIRRRYFELVLVDGRDEVVFRSALSGRWYRQRA